MNVYIWLIIITAILTLICLIGIILSYTTNAFNNNGWKASTIGFTIVCFLLTLGLILLEFERRET
jgi:hypothetical protein